MSLATAASATEGPGVVFASVLDPKRPRGIADSGAGEAIMGKAEYDAAPAGQYFNWTQVDPQYRPAAEVQFGNNSTTTVVNVVGEYRTLPTRGGGLTTKLFGPILVCQHATFNLVSTYRHCQLHNAKVILDRTGMCCVYPDGATVDMVKQGGLFLLPTPPSTGTQTPTTAASILTEPQPPPMHHYHNHNTTTFQTALALAAHHDAPPKPSAPFSVMYKKCLLGQDIDDDDADAIATAFDAARAATTIAESEAAATSQHKTSMKLANLKATLGHRNYNYVRKVAAEENIALTKTDEDFISKTAKLRGSATARPMLKQPPPPIETVPHSRYLVAMDQVTGLPESYQKRHTSWIAVTSSTGRMRAYFFRKVTAKEQVKALKTYLVDARFHVNGAVYGPEVIRTDRHSTYMSSVFTDACTELKARLITSAPGNSGGKVQNHHVENHIRVIWQMSLSMLYSINLSGLPIDPIELWAYAVAHACDIDALLPQLRNGTWIPSAHELETGMKPDRKHLLVFGCQVGVAISSEDRGHNDPHIRLGIYLGRAPHAHPDTVSVLMLDTLQVRASRNIYPDPFPNYDPMPTVNDENTTAGTQVYDPTTDSIITSTGTRPNEDAAVPDPPPPATQPPPSPSTQPPQPPPSPPPPTKQKPKSKKSKPKPTARFQLDQQVTVDYGDAGKFDGIIDNITNKSVTVFFPGEGEYGTQYTVRSHELHIVQPRQPLPPTPSAAARIHEAIADVTNSTKAALTNVLHHGYNVCVTRPVNTKSALLCAAVLMCAIHPAPAIVAMAATIDLTDHTCPDVEDEYNYVAGAFGAVQLPYKRAMKSADRSEWLKAGCAEMAGLEANGTWEYVRHDRVPSNAEVLDTKMFCKIKYDSKGNEIKKKVRTVVLGNQATWQVSYFGSNAATPTLESFRMFCSQAAADNLELYGFDFTQAFASCPIDNDNCYISLPDEFTKYIYKDGSIRPEPTFRGESGIKAVCHLKKALYGMPQSMKIYTELWKKDLLANDYRQSESEPCLFTKASKCGKHVIRVLCYVDDIAVQTTPGNPDLADLKRIMSINFDWTGGDELNWYLGCEIKRNTATGSLTIDQRQFLLDTCNDFLGTSRRKTVDTALPTKFTPTSKDSPQTPVEQARFKVKAAKYRSCLGKLLWLSKVTRCDISHAVSMLGRFAQNPGDAHFNAMIHLAHYLLATPDFCIEYNRNADTTKNELLSFVDADWASCRDSRRSQSGFVALMNGGAVAWSSRRQTTTAMSTMESELVSLCAGSLKTIYLRNLCADLGIPQHQGTIMKVDNKAAITVARNSSINQASRHIALRHFKVRELINAESIVTEHVVSQHNHSDIFTKNVPAAVLAYHRGFLLGIRD